MRVALVHDDLVQWGGAERVLLGLSEIYPEAPIYTSLYDPIKCGAFRTKTIITSFLQKIPRWKSFYKILLPFYGLAFEQFDFSGFDLVISHTTRFAKSIITKPGTKHISYCHTPPRFLWHFSGEKSYGMAEVLLSILRLYDRVSSTRVDYFIAGSENAKKRIKKSYGKDSKVVLPFVDMERFKNIEAFDGGYFVVISRVSKYKRLDLAVKACKELGLPLKVVGGFRDDARGFGEVEFLGNLDDDTVADVLAGARALIIPGEEDFGLTSLEAQALGKPVIAFGKGGALETVIENKTGILFKEQTIDALKDALIKFSSSKIGPDLCKENAGGFSKKNFINNFKSTVALLL